MILKSLLLLGGQGGGLLIDESEWLSLSKNFRNRAEALARSLIQNELQMRTQVHYLVPHLWSHSGILWEELQKKAGPQAKMISTLDLVVREKFSQLLIVDPCFIMTREAVQKLTAWAKAGRVVVVPRSQFYSESARLELEQVMAQTKKIEVDLGFPFQLHAIGDGKLVVYDVLDQLILKDGPLLVLQNFINTVLSIAEVENSCRLGDSRLCQVTFEQKNHGIAVFVLNGSRRQVSADLLFKHNVRISDLGSVFSSQSASLAQSPPVEDAHPPVEPANRFSLDVPPFGVLPLSIEGLSFQELREKQAAARISEETRVSAQLAAASELPGLDEGFEELWS